MRFQRLKTKQAQISKVLCVIRMRKMKHGLVQLKVDEPPVEYKIDNGADINVMNKETFHTLNPERALEPSDLPLTIPGGELCCLDCFNVILKHKREKYPFNVYVVSGHKVNNLLSTSLSLRMNLVR